MMATSLEDYDHQLSILNDNVNTTLITSLSITHTHAHTHSLSLSFTHTHAHAFFSQALTDILKIHILSLKDKLPGCNGQTTEWLWVAGHTARGLYSGILAILLDLDYLKF